LKEKILRLLKESEGRFISGQSISEKLGVTRTAIWKYINQLRKEGYEIESVSRKGYKLVHTPDLLTYEEINDKLKTKYIGKQIIYFDSVNSTNTKAKEIASDVEEGTVLIAEEQTKGRGRLGRNWVSPKGKGIWMSIVIKPDLNPIEASKVTQVAAAAVSEGIRNIGVDNYIKWPNDIIINGKKVCGILTEMSGELNRINYIVVGIGINVNNDIDEFPDELKRKATSLKIESGIKIERKKLVAEILNNFEELYNELVKSNTINKSLKICREYSAVIGREIKIISRSEEFVGKAIDLTEEGELLVKDLKGNVKKIISGEVSVRGIDGYV
jgi:BirA family biotin operon repressor/biotin-[acetyl-CoA-carboxylase] ligase